jgi:hypothetical protein
VHYFLCLSVINLIFSIAASARYGCFASAPDFSKPSQLKEAWGAETPN